jgi:putative endonuclease
MEKHKEKAVEGFTKKYNIDKLVYFEQYQDSVNAINREKRIKKYPRKWKLNLVEKENPHWKDLYTSWFLDTPDKPGYDKKV